MNKLNKSNFEDATPTLKMQFQEQQQQQQNAFYASTQSYGHDVRPIPK